MRALTLLAVAGCTTAPRGGKSVNVAALHDARFEASVSPLGLTAYFRFSDDRGCPELDPSMRATVDGVDVELASPEPDPDAYPRGTPCEGYQIDVPPSANARTDIRIRDRSGEARIVIDNAFAARGVAWRGTPVAGEVARLAWTPATDTVVDGEVSFGGVTARVDDLWLQVRVPNSDDATASMSAHAAIETCTGFASCVATASVRDAAIAR